MTEETTGGTAHTVSQGGVTVHRAVEVDGTEVTVTVELSSTIDEPVLVEVVETLADGLSVVSTEFDSETLPGKTGVSGDRVGFEQAVADESEPVEYELTLSEPVEAITLEPPVIESIEPVAAGAAGCAGDEAPRESRVDAPADGADLELATVSGEGGGSVGRGSLDVRADELDARIEEFAAHTASLGTLVGGRDVSSEFVGRFERRVDDVDCRLAPDGSGVDGASGSVRGDVESLEGDVATLRADLDDTARSLQRVRETTAALHEELGELQAMRASLTEALAGWASSPTDVNENADEPTDEPPTSSHQQRLPSTRSSGTTPPAAGAAGRTAQRHRQPRATRSPQCTSRWPRALASNSVPPD